MVTEHPSNPLADMREINAGFSCLGVRDGYYSQTEREGFVLLSLRWIFSALRGFVSALLWAVSVWKHSVEFHYLLCSREQDAKIKGEYQEMTGGSSEPKNVRKQRVIRRIQEYKKFRSNCQRLREFIKEKHQLRQNILASHKVRILSVGGRSKSEQALLRRGGVVKNDRLMGRLCVSSPNLSQDLSLEEAIHLWRLKRDR